MKPPPLKFPKALEALRRLALTYPETEEATVCTRTSFKARKKSFVFMGLEDETYDVFLKLEASRAKAVQLAKKEPKRYSVGNNGWTTATFKHAESPPRGLLEGWIDESFHLLAPKTLVKLHGESGGKPAAKAVKKSPRK